MELTKDNSYCDPSLDFQILGYLEPVLSSVKLHVFPSIEQRSMIRVHHVLNCKFLFWLHHYFDAFFSVAYLI